MPELTWILFLRILDAQEEKARDEAEAVGATFAPALASPYRWQDWAAPFSEKEDHPKASDVKPYGWKRQELFAAGDGRLFDFINTGTIRMAPISLFFGANSSGKSSKCAQDGQSRHPAGPGL